ncbi:MAG TPA: Clp protease N-terminal domain-containing protein, partial [Actinomycetes bacterium]
MFERFTDRARRVVVLAQEEARMLNHNYIGTEHILLGLIHEGEGVAAKALESLGISLEAVRSQVEEIIGQGQQAPSGHIPFTPRAKKVLELSLREALQLGHNYIGTEHILLGLIHEGEGVAAKALESLGISLEAVRAQVEEIIGHGGQAPSGHIPFTPRAKKVLELSLREALQLGHNSLGTEHILLGLIREGEGVAAQVLVKLGADLSRVRQQVIQLLSGY